MLFWTVTAFILAFALVLLWRAIAVDGEGDGAEDHDVQVYRDQLREVDRDAARGVLSAEDAERTRVEVSRRLLEADAKAQAGTTVQSSKRGMIPLALAIALVVGASYVTYLQVGAPGYPDLPLQARINAAEEFRATRPDQASVEAEMPPRTPVAVDPQVETMVARLREILETRPDDLQGFRLLARHEAGIGNPGAAWRAQARVVELLGAEAQAQDYAALGELQVLAAGGYVSPEAETALAQALERDPRNGTARYYVGLMQAQVGRPDLAFNTWRRLIADSSENAPWLEPIYLQIEDVSRLAGDPTPLDQLPRPRPVSGSPALPGPSADQVGAASELSMAERMEMIQGMVNQLADRLASEGGPPQEWARLITSLGVVGRTDDAYAVYLEATQRFEGNQGALDIIVAAADQAGVNPDGLEFLE